MLEGTDMTLESDEATGHESEVVTMKDGRTFAAETVTMRDGRRITLRELDGMDDIIGKRLVNAKTAGEMLVLPEVMLVLAVAKVDGKEVARATSMTQIQTFLREVPKKDKTRLEKAYARLNEDDDEGEADAAGGRR